MSDSTKSGGKFQKTQGVVEETIGNITGATSWQQSGKEKKASGQSEIETAQAKGYAEGTKDRAGGKVDQLMGATTGDRSQEAAGNVRNQKGSTLQDVNK